MADKRNRGASLAHGEVHVADQFGAREKYGFNTAQNAPLVKVPKLNGQWFAEFQNAGGKMEYAEKVKSVSDISINVEFETYDQYGRVARVPTRVIFPTVTIELYDTVDGKIFEMATEIYESYFSNNTLPTDATELDASIKGNTSDYYKKYNHGLKLRDGRNHSNASQHFFNKVSMYHFFGSAEEESDTMQKIEILNPLVSNISFSASSYEDSSLRTITITLEPENIKILPARSSQDKDPMWEVPQWIAAGTDYIEPGKYKRNKLATSALASGRKQREELLDNMIGDIKPKGIETDLALLAHGSKQQLGKNQWMQPGKPPSLGDSLTNGLLNSFFDGTPFSLKDIGKEILGSAIGNTKTGQMGMAINNPTSRFGVAGDILRDSIKSGTNSTALSSNGGGGIGSAPGPSGTQQHASPQPVKSTPVTSSTTTSTTVTVLGDYKTIEEAKAAEQQYIKQQIQQSKK